MAQTHAPEKTNEKTDKPLTLEEFYLRIGIMFEGLAVRMEALEKKIDEKGTARGSRQSQREMTDDDARAVLGELAKLKHNEAADKLGLSYGQVYSARLGYTFKHIRKELTDAKVANQWLDSTHVG